MEEKVQTDGGRTEEGWGLWPGSAEGSYSTGCGSSQLKLRVGQEGGLGRKD